MRHAASSSGGAKSRIATFKMTLNPAALVALWPESF